MTIEEGIVLVRDPRQSSYPDCPPSPAFCPECGNLDFYLKEWAWQCGWCVPQMLRVNMFVRDPGANTGKMLLGVDEAGKPKYEPCYRTSSNFDDFDIYDAWPPGWLPPNPCGPTVRLRRELEGEDD